MINLKVNKNLMKTSKLVLTLVDFVVFKKEIKNIMLHSKTVIFLLF